MSSLSFQLQSGAYKEPITIDSPEISLKELRDRAVKFINEKYPSHGLGDLVAEHLLFYRHDLRSINILQLISTATEVTDGTLVEVIISSVPQCDRILVHPHTLYVHSYKSPTFCDFCGEMLFGLVKQGLKCQGCGLNYHKRCASKIPNNCSGARQRRPSVIPLSPKHSLNLTSQGFGMSSGGGDLGVGATSTPINASHSMNPPGSPRLTPSLSQVTLTPNIVVSSDDDNSSAFSSGVKDEGSMFLGAPMSRPARSGSWSGRPLWMEVEDAKRTKVPHTFQVHTYTRPTVCQHCKKLLKGLIRQGLQCRDCKYNCHKKCEEFAAKECTGGSGMTPSPSFLDLSRGDSALGSSDDSQSICGDQSDHEGDAEPIHMDRPTTSEPNDESNLNESSNIPLQRIVQSKKNTKRPGTRVMREGWMIHYTNRNPMKKRHYWRLDTKAITLYNDDTSNRYYKEIPLSDILNIRTASDADKANLARRASHCFELKTASVTYYVGLGDSKQLEHATQWEQAIKHAYMPVTPQSSTGPVKETLQVPTPGKPGQLGSPIQSEVEFSQIYQIFPEEVLGSGQFGTVYGGVQRKTGKHVAVKVIDKMKFPSKQEAALRTEVDILQKVKHPAVVEFEQMFETVERIFVVMEKMKGDMLEMILSSEKGKLSERITEFLVCQILVALRYLHTQNIVHCDLKPENILLASDSDFPLVKLCDFGFARIIGERSFRRSVVGTPAYLAPEVLLNKGFNRSLDMWSVGVIVYVSLSGTFPFNEDEDINDQIQNAAFMYPQTPWKDISSDAIEFINSLLQVKINKRLTVHKALAHVWLQNYQLWCDSRRLEREVGERYITHESDDARWREYETQNSITPNY